METTMYVLSFCGGFMTCWVVTALSMKKKLIDAAREGFVHGVEYTHGVYQKKIDDMINQKDKESYND